MNPLSRVGTDPWGQVRGLTLQTANRVSRGGVRLHCGVKELGSLPVPHTPSFLILADSPRTQHVLLTCLPPSVCLGWCLAGLGAPWVKWEPTAPAGGATSPRSTIGMRGRAPFSASWPFCRGRPPLVQL